MSPQLIGGASLHLVTLGTLATLATLAALVTLTTLAALAALAKPVAVGGLGRWKCADQ